MTKNGHHDASRRHVLSGVLSLWIRDDGGRPVVTIHFPTLSKMTFEDSLWLKEHLPRFARASPGAGWIAMWAISLLALVGWIALVTKVSVSFESLDEWAGRLLDLGWFVAVAAPPFMVGAYLRKALARTIWAVVQSGTCANCVYDIHGLPTRSIDSVVCPECGAVWRLTLRGKYPRRY